MKPIFNKIFNQIDKIYSEQTGMIYPVSAAVGGNGPVPGHRLDINKCIIDGPNSFGSFHNVYDIAIYFNSIDFPEGWYGIVSGDNIVDTYGSLEINAETYWDDRYNVYNPADVNGVPPQNITVTIYDQDGNVWGSGTHSLEWTGLLVSNSTFTQQQDGTYIFTCNLNMGNEPANWAGQMQYDDGQHTLIDVNFDSTNITNNILTLNIPSSTYELYHQIYIYIFTDSTYTEMWKDAYDNATIIPFEPGKDYFKVENMGSNNNTITVTKHGNPSTGADLSFSTDKDTWILCTYDQNNDCSITLGAHEAVYFRSSTGFSQNYDAYYSIDSTNPIAVSGDLRTLIDYTDDQLNTAQSYGFYKLFAGNTNLGVCAIDFNNITTLNNHCYFSMFEGCTMLTVTSPLNATTLAECCYNRMFKGCTSLNVIPTSLPATTLTSACYGEMFAGCTSLRNSLRLPATTLASNCYIMMFQGCTSLTTTYPLPATTLTNGCYYSMFKGCTSLVSQPEISATTLAEYSCREMFQGCTSLTNGRAPQGATTLTDKCYQSMYKGCTSLTNGYVDATTLAVNSLTEMYNGCSNVSTITSEAEEWGDDYSTNWVQGVAASGTFYNNGNATIPTGDSGIPTGWTVE